jgi:hypothetical protein
MSNNTAGGAGGRASNTGRRKGRRRSAPQAGPGDEEMIMLCNSIAKSLSMCPKLTVIELPGVALGHGALRQLGKGLAVTTSLKRLDLTNCGLGDEGLGGLSKALISCKSLNDLCLSGNRLNDNSATRISSIIRRHSARRDDHFWASCLRDGATSAASARNLKPSSAEIAVQLQGLIALDISNNALTNIGIAEIAATLECDGWLVALNMRGNQVSDQGANAIKNALQINESLSVIDFRPRDELPTFDDMGNVIHKSPKKNRVEMMGWAMRRKPRKGIGAEHPEVEAVLNRWGLAGDACDPVVGGTEKGGRRGKGSSFKKNNHKKTSAGGSAMKQPTRMSSKSNNSNRRHGLSSTSSDVDTKRSTSSPSNLLLNSTCEKYNSLVLTSVLRTGRGPVSRPCSLPCSPPSDVSILLMPVAACPSCKS